MRKQLLFALIFLVGCTTIPRKENIIAIDRDGELELPGHTIFGTQKIKETENYQKDVDPEIEYIKIRIDDALKENNKIAIYIHGGLNYPSASVDKANKISEEIQKTGYSPIFIDWRSGFWTTYKEHLLHSRQGEYLEFWGPLTAPFVFLEDIGRGVVRAPMRFFQVMNNYGKSILFSDYGGENNANELSKHYLADDVLKDQCSSNNPDHLNNKYGFGELPELCDKRSTATKFKDGLLNFGQATIALTTAPVFDTLATSAWATMKRRTEIMFTKRICYDQHDGCDYRKNSIEEYQSSKEGAASKFFRALKEKQDQNKDLKILLVGHSMGTIVANNVLTYFPDIEFEKIVYLASAASFKDFEESVVPYMRKHNSTSFYNITLHPIAENVESQYFGFGQTGTLLTQIDNFYESPVSENKRTLGRWVNVVNNLTYIDGLNGMNDIKRNLHFRTLPYEHNGEYPQTHGGLDDDYRESGEFWLGNLGQNH